MLGALLRKTWWLQAWAVFGLVFFPAAHTRADEIPPEIQSSLAILKQDRAFEGLHWWDSVLAYQQSELLKYNAEAATLGKAKADQDKRDELDFKRRRILTERKEFEALFFAYRGARTFFREEELDEDEDAIAMQV